MQELEAEMVKGQAPRLSNIYIYIYMSLSLYIYIYIYICTYQSGSGQMATFSAEIFPFFPLDLTLSNTVRSPG